MTKPSRIVFLTMAPLILVAFLQALAPSRGRLWGRVLDDRGKPIVHAKVLLSDVRKSQIIAATVSGGGGRYAFNNVAPGAYDLSAEAANYIGERLGPFGVPQDSATAQDIHLQTIQYAASGALLNLNDERATRQFAAAKLSNDQTQVFLLGLYLKAKQPGYAQEVRSAQNKLGSSAVISGQALGAPNARVEVLNTLTGQKETVTTDSNGRYTASVFPVGTYQVQLVVPCFAKAVREGVKVKPYSAVAVNFSANPAKGPGTITVGMTVSQTGSFNVDALEQHRGVELWRDQVNAAGGIKVGSERCEVRFVTYDDESTGSRVQQLYTRLILDDKAEFLISPYSSGLTAMAAIVSEQYGKIMITTGGAERNTYGLENKRLFQIFTPASKYLVSALDVLRARDPHARLAFVYSDDPFSNAVAAAGKAYAKQVGLNVVFDEAYGLMTTDFSPIIDKLLSAKADALVGGGHYADGSTLARQLYAQKPGMKFVCLLVAPDNPKFAQLGDAAYGVTVPSQWEPEARFKPQFGPTSAAFVKAYEDKYQAPPSYESAGGYAAGLVLQHAIEQAGALDPSAVTEALDRTDLTLFYGQVKFATAPNEHGLQVAHEMVLAQWQRNKQGQLVKQVVWPETAITAKLIYPLR